ncbi:unnamed protein product [Linum tenue]|uniref:Uncharacterized protein n=1 Tax=Linum tenue TaxID=586396 RepID=A0AAV0P494_9ROSI|nr:unnamed protein product [Linum tenue]
MRYRGLPRTKQKMASKMAKAESPNAKPQPLFSATHTMKVTPTTAPVTRLKKNQLKKLESFGASSGFLGSNWSAPNAGSAALTPPAPKAMRYSPM